MKRLPIVAAVFFALAILFGKIESVFYGNRLDANGVLQESWFTPLAVFSALIAVALLLVWTGHYLLGRLSRR